MGKENAADGPSRVVASPSPPGPSVPSSSIRVSV